MTDTDTDTVTDRARADRKKENAAVMWLRPVTRTGSHRTAALFFSDRIIPAALFFIAQYP